jgi:hypothetical protein
MTDEMYCKLKDCELIRLRWHKQRPDWCPLVTGERKGEPMINRETYCSDCDRSIYGKYHDCDVNIENDGKYVLADEKCYCKIVNGERAEKYPWERRTDE